MMARRRLPQLSMRRTRQGFSSAKLDRPQGTRNEEIPTLKSEKHEDTTVFLSLSFSLLDRAPSLPLSCGPLASFDRCGWSVAYGRRNQLSFITDSE